MSKIVIADDHPLLLEGLYNQLLNIGFTSVYKAKDGQEACELIVKHNPDIAILDIEMPFIDGISIANKFQNGVCKTKFVILTFLKEPEFLLKAKKLNLSGYVLKEDAISEIEFCLKTILKGEKYYSKVFDSSEMRLAQNNMGLIESLTPSELKIIKLIIDKYTTKNIADKLFISERTVEKHRSNIINKLELKEKTISLYNWAIENQTFFNF